MYVFGDIFTEVYGYAQSRKAIWAGFFSLLLLAISLEVTRILPSADFWQHQEAYNTILGRVPRIIIAGIIAYLCGEFVNSYVLAKMKVRFSGQNVPLRLIASTICGQAVDTAIFVLIAFAGIMSLQDGITVFLSAWLFKIVWEVIALPVSVPVIAWLKHVENSDVFDKDTDFIHFKIS